MKVRVTAAGLAPVIVVFLLISFTARAQRGRGELRIEARDPQGAALVATAELTSEANQFRRTFPLGPDGHYVVQDLAFGISFLL